MYIMFLLPPHLRKLLKKKAEKPRIFLQDQHMVSLVKKVAKEQGRPQEEIIADFAKAGLKEFTLQNDMKRCWSSLSRRERQVVALICLGNRNYEIAEILTIAPETVKTHLQHIFNKFDLRSSKELRIVLKDWDFVEWWENNRQD
jgi:DNA-binding CsgD family transcriptional regulator